MMGLLYMNSYIIYEDLVLVTAYTKLHHNKSLHSAKRDWQWRVLHLHWRAGKRNVSSKTSTEPKQHKLSDYISLVSTALTLCCCCLLLFGYAATVVKGCFGFGYMSLTGLVPGLVLFHARLRNYLLFFFRGHFFFSLLSSSGANNTFYYCVFSPPAKRFLGSFSKDRGSHSRGVVLCTSTLLFFYSHLWNVFYSFRLHIVICSKCFNPPRMHGFIHSSKYLQQWLRLTEISDLLTA